MHNLRIYAASLKADEVVFGPGGFDFKQPEKLPEEATRRAQEIVESGILFRYQSERCNDVALLEREFANYVGHPFAMACNSGGCGIFLALKALGVKPGDKVLLNAWTLSPVPGAIVHAGCEPVFVESEPSTWSIDIDNLEIQAQASGAKVLLLSYMRGHVPNLDRLLEVVKRHNLLLVEDCAHTLGATWKLDGEAEHRHLGTFGDVGVWSMQTNKSINAGEGGVITTARQDVASYVTVATGSYGHYALNGCSGDLTNLKEKYPHVANMSMRLTTLAAALARPQLRYLDEKVKKFENHAVIIRDGLEACPHIRLLRQDAWRRKKEVVVWSSIQFELLGFSPQMVDDVISRMDRLGVPLAWFGGPCTGFTSTLRDWRFADPTGEKWCESHERFVKTLVDLPLYHTSQWPTSAFEKMTQLLVREVSTVAGMLSARADGQN